MPRENENHKYNLNELRDQLDSCDIDISPNITSEKPSGLQRIVSKCINSKYARIPLAFLTALSIGIPVLSSSCREPPKVETPIERHVTIRESHSYPIDDIFIPALGKERGELILEVKIPKEIESGGEKRYIVTLKSPDSSFLYSTLVFGANDEMIDFSPEIKTFRKYDGWEGKNTVGWDSLEDLAKSQSYYNIISEIAGIVGNWIIEGYKNRISQSLPEWAKSDEYETTGILFTGMDSELAFTGVRWEVPVVVYKDEKMKIYTISRLNYSSTPVTLETDFYVDVIEGKVKEEPTPTPIPPTTPKPVTCEIEEIPSDNVKIIKVSEPSLVEVIINNNKINIDLPTSFSDEPRNVEIYKVLLANVDRDKERELLVAYNEYDGKYITPTFYVFKKDDQGNYRVPTEIGYLRKEWLVEGYYGSCPHMKSKFIDFRVLDIDKDGVCEILGISKGKDRLSFALSDTNDRKDFGGLSPPVEKYKVELSDVTNDGYLDLTTNGWVWRYNPDSHIFDLINK